MISLLEVKKRENESSSAFLRRFKKQLQKSGLLLLVRKKMYHTKPKSKLKIREAAAKRQETKKEMDYLRKIGKLKVEQ